ncbi:MAG: hypothetical protein IH944_08295 [Armatimonadetes bacterium]|nr:hypothetical protein [Armatimonadota bacterium]
MANRLLLRLIAVSVLAVVPLLALAANGTIKLTAFPTITVSDGRTTITVTAEVRDGSGRPVPDGTRVVFETTLGTFRTGLVATQNGLAQATLVASSIPGTAKVRAAVLQYGANALLRIQFVSDPSLLSSRKDYIEVVSSNTMTYSYDDRILEASATDKGVHIRYRDITIDADDVQIQVPNYEVRARRATLKIGDTVREYEELYIRLNQRRGLGTTVYEAESYQIDRAWLLVNVRSVVRDRLGLVDIDGEEISPHVGAISSALLGFKDISQSITIIRSKKAIAYPTKEVHFYRAEVIVGGETIMRLPLYKASTHPQSPIITDSILTISNNRLAIDYPYYLDLAPGRTSLLRFRYGNRYSTGVGVSGGTYLDYEYKWNQGHSMDGGLVVSGLLRDDWGAAIRQYWRTDAGTSISAQLNFPAHRSVFATANINHDFEGFHATVSASRAQSLRGAQYQNDQYLFVLEKDPIKLGSLPVRVYLGLTASESNIRSEFFNGGQSRVGLRARFISKPWTINRRNSVSASYTFSRFEGSQVTSNMSHLATVSMVSNFGNGLFLQTTYDYVADGFTEQALGRHRLTADAYYSRGAWTMRTFASRSLDVDRLSASVSLDVAFSSQWRTYYNYFLDQYAGDSYFDQTIVLAYRIGLREVGLSYSNRTKRIGIEILGARFN